MKNVKNVIILSAIAVFASACGSNSSDGGGGGAGAFGDAPSGSFQVLTKDQMAAQGLTEKDFEPNTSEESKLDPRIQVGMSQTSAYMVQFKSGATAKSVSKMQVTRLLANLVEVTAEYISSISLLGGEFKGSEVQECKVVNENGWSHLDCQTTKKEEPPLPPGAEEIAKQAVSCRVERNANGGIPEETKEFGFYTLNGHTYKAVKSSTSTSGEVTCSDNASLGQGGEKSVSITTSEIPNLSYPSRSAAATIFWYSEVSVTGAIVTKSRLELQ